MALPQAVQNTQKTLSITWNQRITEDQTTVTAETLTGLTITGVIEGKPGSTYVQKRAISGTLAVSDGAAGQFTWTYDATDTATPGHFNVVFEAASGGGTPIKTFPYEWEVVRAPTVS